MDGSISSRRVLRSYPPPQGPTIAEVSRKKMWLWVDSGSPVMIFSRTDLKATLAKANLNLQPKREQFQEYNNYRIHLLGKIKVTSALNGWATQAKVRILGITGEDSDDCAEGLDEFKYISESYNQFFLQEQVDSGTQN